MADPGLPVDATLPAPGSDAGVSAAQRVSIPGGSGAITGAELVAGRYQLLGLIGAGGMGSVYRVRDRELDEVVALKVLRRELVDSTGALARFRQEVKLARKVTHPNVARTFDIGEHDGEKYLTMEYVDGPSLARILEDRGALGVSEAIRIGRAIAEGLAAAHKVGVVHRDLKPDNVLVAGDDRVVVTDFGIARARDREGAVQTAADHLVGTPAYMAPEQVEGGEVDARTDVYALGLVLYELLTGERAWPGDSPYAVAAARLIHPPPDALSRRPDTPVVLSDLVKRCMARAPGERFATAGDVALALGSVAAGPVGGGDVRAATAGPPAPMHDDRSVALLPFKNAGPPDDAWIADGLTDDLIDGLCMTRGLKVRARGMVWPYKDSREDPREIGRRLDVQVVVDGSVRRAGDDLRITTRLVNVADGFQLWARRFDCRIADLLRVNDDATRAIAEALSAVPLGPTRGPAGDPRAIELLLRARRMLGLHFPGTGTGIELLREAMALSPSDPRILAEYARYCTRELFNPARTSGGLGEARAYAQLAVDGGPHLGEPWVAMAHVLHNSDDTPGAVRALRRALECAPSLGEAHDLIGRILLEADLVEEATRMLERALWLDPQLAFGRVDLARAHALRGEWAKVDSMVTILFENSPVHHWIVWGRLSLWRGRALSGGLPKRPELPKNFQSHLVAVFHELVDGGSLSSEDRALLRSNAENTPPRSRPRRLFNQILAEIMAHVGDREAALEAVEAAVEAGLLDLGWMRRCPLLEPLRSEPAMERLTSRVAEEVAPVIAAFRAERNEAP